jgi:cell division protein FtsL
VKELLTMTAKLTALTVVIIGLALGLLYLRTSQAYLARDIARISQQTRDAQHELWKARSEVAAVTNPQALAERIAAAQLVLEPAAPPPPAAHQAELAHSIRTHRRTASP